VALWRRGIDTELFHPSRASREMRTYLSEGHPESPLLLYVGRLSSEKNIEQLRSFLNAIPGARLALVGGGPHKEQLAKYFKDTPTFLAGYMEGARLAAAFSSADLFVLPSRTETLGLVLLEAMASGCPVIAARAGGIPDLIEDRVSGFLFDEATEGIEATGLLLLDETRRERIRSRGRVEAEKWSWAAATYQLRGFYVQEQSAKGKASINADNRQMTRLAKLAAMGAIRRALH
jgi:glycosyltransferase involved in cell wall biosynthesis